MTYTQGEWKKYGDAYERKHYEKGACKMFQCRIETGLTAIAHCYGWTEAEAEGNARLIAAAPKLLEALQKIANNAPQEEPEAVWGTGNEDDARDYGAENARWYAGQIAKDAIAAAKGE